MNELNIVVNDFLNQYDPLLVIVLIIIFTNLYGMLVGKLLVNIGFMLCGFLSSIKSKFNFRKMVYRGRETLVGDPFLRGREQYK